MVQLRPETVTEYFQECLVATYFVRSVPDTNSMTLSAARSSPAWTMKQARVFTTKGALTITDATILSTTESARLAFTRSLSKILLHDVTLMANGSAAGSYTWRKFYDEMSTIRAALTP